jgi:hypothetical protein
MMTIFGHFSVKKCFCQKKKISTQIALILFKKANISPKIFLLIITFTTGGLNKTD